MRRHQAVSRVALAAIAAVAVPQYARAQGVEHIRLVGPPTEDLTSLYYAIKNGLFQRTGVDVELVGTSSGAAATTAVIAGTYELAKTSLIAVFTAYLRNIPVVIVAPELVYTPRGTRSPCSRSRMTHRTGLAPTSTADRRRPCAQRPQHARDPGLGRQERRRFEAAEVRRDSELRDGAALQQHRIDAAMLQSPQLDASLAAGTTKTLGDGYGAIAPTFYLGCFIARRDWASQHPDALRKFSRVMAEANGYVNTHPTETAPLVAELTKITLANTEKMHRSLIGTTLELGLIQPLIDVAAKYDLIPRRFAAREIVWTS